MKSATDPAAPSSAARDTSEDEAPLAEAAACDQGPDRDWAAYESVLRQQWPSKEELLAEARALSVAQRQAQRRRASGAGLATLLLVLAGTWWLDPVWRSQTVQTAVGERSVWTLADGSRIDVNTDSTLVIEHRLRSRSVRLERGEALFTVTHHWRPFVVQTPHSSVRDIGTVFAIRVQSGQDQVVVQQGAVEVAVPGQPRALLLYANQALTVRPGEWPLEPKSIPLVQQEVGDLLAWQHGRLVFRSTPLAQVVEQIQRYRPYRLQIADQKLAALRLSGAYDIIGLDQLVRDLPHIIPVQLLRDKQGYVIQGLKPWGQRSDPHGWIVKTRK